MGQKVNPRSMRMQLTRDWDSVWYADSDSYADFLYQDFLIRDYIKKTFKHAQIAKIVIKRQSDLLIIVYATKVGIIIGRGGADVEKIKKVITKIASVQTVEVSVTEVRRPDTSAILIANAISQQLERRVSFRKAMKRAISNSLRLGVRGIRVSCSGRLGGAEIARTEWYREGSIPLHTLKAGVDYALYEAHTTYGVIGTKVWVYV